MASQDDDIYSKPEIYDQITEGDCADIDFFIEESKKWGQPILELGCGSGRILNQIAAQGLLCVGLDLSTEMIAKAQEKAQAKKLQVEYQVQDMRTFSLNQKFKLIFVAMNSLLHLHEEAAFK